MVNRNMLWFRLMFALLVLVSVSLACNLPFSSQPSPELEPIPVSTEAANTLVDSVKEAIDHYQKTGELQLVMNESQLTSIIAFSLQEQSEFDLVDPQVYLRDGQVILIGGVEQVTGRVNAEITMQPGVDTDGQPQLKIISARLGILPLPAMLLNEVTSAASDLIAQQIRAAGADFRLESITVGDGQLEIRGSKH